MADRIAANISVGGHLPKTLVDEIAAAIVNDDAGENWGDPFAHIAQARQAIADAVASNTPLYLYNDQACWGEFENIENFCKEHGLVFDRASEPKYEYDGERVLFDGTTLHEAVAGVKGRVTLSLDQVRKAHEEGTLHALLASLAIFEAATPPLVIADDPETA